MLKMGYYYKGVKVSIWGKSNNQYTIVFEDKETAERLGGFERYDESYLSWFLKRSTKKKLKNIESIKDSFGTEEEA